VTQVISPSSGNDPDTPARPVEQALWAVQRRVSGCRVVAYCDLEASLVLRHVASPAVRQELLDQLSADAHAAFALRATALACCPPGFGGGADDGPDVEQVRLIDDRGVRLFLRSPQAPQDALLLLCDTVQTADRVLPEAQALLLALLSDPGMGTI